MRNVSVVALLISAASLGGCAAGGGTLDASGFANDLAVCGLKCDLLPKLKDPATNGGGPVGDGGDEDGEAPPGANNGNSGNTADFKGGDETIALEAGVVVTDYGSPSKSKLTLNGDATTAKFEIETKTANNALWARAKTMDEFKFGTVYPFVVPLAPGAHIDLNGNNIPDSDGFGEALFANGISDSAMGGTYKEYRSYVADSKKPYDETLQVWTFDDSFVVQYRDETSGRDTADKQAWSVGTKAGGVQTKAAAMPSSRATATYTGKFGSTAVTSGWVDSDDSRQKVSYNNTWRVRGSATGNVNFTTSRAALRLQPQFWSTWADINGHKGQVLINALDGTDPNNPGYLYSSSFMAAQIELNGVLTKKTTGNNIKGRAKLNAEQGWLSDGTTSMFFGGLYGADADELSGVFATSGTMPAPTGGNLPLNNPRRGRLSHSGGLNVKKN